MPRGSRPVHFVTREAISGQSGGDILKASPRGIEYDDLVLIRPGRLHSRQDLSQFGMNRRARHEVARDELLALQAVDDITWGRREIERFELLGDGVQAPQRPAKLFS